MWSEASGLYKNSKRHAAHCPHCSPDRLRQITAAERANKENRISATAETESSQFADTPHSRAAVDGELTDVFALFCFTPFCSPEVQQQPWATWVVDKRDLHHYNGHDGGRR